MDKETKSQRKRRYYLHYKLKKGGISTRASERTVFVNHTKIGDTEDPFRRYIGELKEKGYNIQLEI